MSEELDDLASAMFNNVVPNAFSKVGPLSLKPLACLLLFGYLDFSSHKHSSQELNKTSHVSMSLQLMN